MAVQRLNFTASWISSVKAPESGRTYYRDTTIRQLELCVSKTGSKVYYRVGRVSGASTRTRIGAHPDITLKVARDICQELNSDVAAGRQVATTRRTTTQSKRLDEVYEWFIEHHAKPSKRTWKRDVSTWEADVKPLGKHQIDLITRPQVVEIFNRVTKDRGPGAGNKALELVRMLFSVARTNKWTENNPAAKITRNKLNERERFLLPDEVEIFFRELAKSPERFQDFIKLCLFTSARRANVMAMAWDEISFERALWIIPTHKAKTKKPIVLPLTEPAIEILTKRFNRRTGDNPWVFPSPASATGHYVEPKDGWQTLRNRTGLADLNIHDLRRTIASWQAAASVSAGIIAKSLGHTTTRSTHVYTRLALDPVREAMSNAAGAIQKASEPKKSEND